MTPAPPNDPFPGEDIPVPMAEPGAHAPPAEVDYAVIRLIGQGGYGEVWLVRDQAGNYHACKVVYRESFQQDRPYEREYEGIRKFEPVSRASESQIKILHVGRRDAAGYFFYIMELADDVATGRNIHPNQYIPRTLKSDLRRIKRLPMAECLRIGETLSAALENLHQHGLIHRDIKPDNIIFANGQPKLADIGLVTDLEVTVSHVGTEGYIPPEGPTSPQADIYSLGKVLYEISTGKDRLEYPELPADFAEIPNWESLLELNAVVTKACETNPARRYASAKELHADLTALIAGKSVRRRQTARRIGKVGLQICAALALVGLAAGGWIYLAKHPFSPPAGVLANTAPVKLPLPEAARLAQCETTIKSAYVDRAAGGANAQQQAAELFNRSSAESDPAMELASLRVAAQLEIEAADFSRAMQMCDHMAERFNMEVSPVKANLLTEAAARLRTGRDKSELAGTSLPAGFQAVATDDYTSAKTIADIAAAAAQQTGNATFLRESKFLSAETAQCAAAYERITNFATVLRNKPADSAANLAMGKFLCFVKNDWGAGLPLLARGGDSSFAPMASQEISEKLENPPDQVALGDQWWNASITASDDDRAGSRQRARHWYLTAIAGSKEPDQSRLRQALADHLKSVPTEPGEVHIFSRVGGTEVIDIFDNQVRWRSSKRGAAGNKINQVNLGYFGSSDVQIINNCGVTWLMPAAVDFSSAKLDRDRKQGRHGQATLAIFEDHVRVTLSHPQEGTAPLDVTVTFGASP